MLHYVGIVPVQPNPLADKVTNDLRTALSAWEIIIDDMCCFLAFTGTKTSNKNVLQLNSEAGAIFGRIFPRQGGLETAEQAGEFDKTVEYKIVATKGQSLIADFWGKYVAVFTNQACGATYILRDPTAALPCYYITVDGLLIFFSHYEDIKENHLIDNTLNWSFIENYFLRQGQHNSETGVLAITELRGGECIEVKNGHIEKHLYWKASYFATDVYAENDPSVAASELKKVTRQCVLSWASGYTRIIHKLSGGVDSSIILAILNSMKTGPEVNCLNFYTDESEGDERKFAQLLCNKTGHPLITHRIEPGNIRLEDVTKIIQTPKPSPLALALSDEPFMEALSYKHNSEAFFMGCGGDTLFFQLPMETIPSDYLSHYGFSSDFVATVTKIARYSRRSVWNVLPRSVLFGLMPRLFNPYSSPSKYKTFVRRHKKISFKSFLCDRNRSENRKIPPSKLLQMISLTDSVSYPESFGYIDYADSVCPLLSQPLIEYCLRMPCHMLTHGGIARGLVRKAFAQELPDKIINRRGKGNVTSYVHKIIAHNQKFIHEFLLDGILTAEGILDREALEKYFSTVQTGVHNNGPELFAQLHDAISVEAWIRNWVS